MDDDRIYRTELIYATRDGGAFTDRAGWTLFVDAAEVAHTAERLPADRAKRWGNRHLGEGMDWQAGDRRGFYWVATPGGSLL